MNDNDCELVEKGICRWLYSDLLNQTGVANIIVRFI